MNVRIITDGGADLPKDIVNQYNIGVVAVHIHFEDQDFTSDTLDAETFYSKMKNSKVLPKTASPTPQQFLEEYRKGYAGEPIVVITTSKEVSSTYDHACYAKQLFLEEQPDALIEVIDSRSGSAAMTLLTVQAARLSEKGTSFSELVKTMLEKVKATHTFFVLETLENVIKGGRLDRVKGAIASMLNIKLVLFANEGKIDVLEKVRGTQNALKRLIDQIGVYSKNFEDKILSIAHGNCEEKAQKLVQEIVKKYPFAEVLISTIGPAMGTYAGEGAIVLAYE